jgi:nitrogen-specific signal transduction histidine kinase
MSKTLAYLNSYVQKMINTLGGSIKFESEPGNTCFTITLPTIRAVQAYEAPL